MSHELRYIPFLKLAFLDRPTVLVIRGILNDMAQQSPSTFQGLVRPGSDEFADSGFLI